MSLSRKLRRRAPAPSRPTIQEFWRRVLTPEQFAELPKDGEAACGARPPDPAVPAACIFRVGHRGPCRYFGDLEAG